MCVCVCVCVRKERKLDKINTDTVWVINTAHKRKQEKQKKKTVKNARKKS